MSRYNQPKTFAFLGALLLVVCGCAEEGGGPLSSTDIQAVEAASRAYGEAWLSNDPEKVMDTLTMDAVIVPSGMSALRGEEAIRAFWWPDDSPSTTVNEFTSTEDEVGGRGDLAFVQGSFSLSFEYDGVSYSSGGTYFCLLKRLPNGHWRISHRTWSDRPRI